MSPSRTARTATAHRPTIGLAGLAAVLLGLAATLGASCAPSSDIEPVPSPTTPPANLTHSALGAEGGWVNVVGDAPSVVPGTTVVLTNVASGALDRAVADEDGGFALSLPAGQGDGLRLAAEGYQAVDLTAAAPADGAPRAPGNPAAPLSSSGIDADGRAWVGCGAGCAPAGVTLHVVNPLRGSRGVAVADTAGSALAPVEAGPGDIVFVFAVAAEAGPATTVQIPLGIDADEDGFDATRDCADDDPKRNPDRKEKCNGVDDDCDGEVDEECGGPPCRPDGSCPGILTCDEAAGVCLAPGAQDTDGDGVANPADVCPSQPDPEQRDTDGDGRGDACDVDVDGDLSPAPLDCDDTDPLRGHFFPERCGDGVDNDCSGAVDEGC